MDKNVHKVAQGLEIKSNGFRCWLMLFYIMMTLIRRRLQGRDLEPFTISRSFAIYKTGREAYARFFFFFLCIRSFFESHIWEMIVKCRTSFYATFYKWGPSSRALLKFTGPGTCFAGTFWKRCMGQWHDAFLSGFKFLLKHSYKCNS